MRKGVIKKYQQKYKRLYKNYKLVKMKSFPNLLDSNIHYHH